MLKQKYKAKVWLIKLRYLIIKKVFSFHRYFLPFLKSIIDFFFCLPVGKTSVIHMEMFCPIELDD